MMGLQFKDKNEAAKGKFKKKGVLLKRCPTQLRGRVCLFLIYFVEMACLSSQGKNKKGDRERDQVKVS